MKKRLLFIINPNSGTGNALRVEKAISSYIDASRYDYEIRKTSAPGEAGKYARKAAEQNYTAAIAVGGDGTVNEVGTALIGSKTALGIIPTGSGNGLARHLGIPLSIKESLFRINDLRTSVMDTATMEGIPFLNIAGIGFDARISHAFANRHRRGLSGYVKVIAKQIFQFKPLNINWKSNDKSGRSKYAMLSVANGSQFGNNALVAPSAQINDGLLDICLVSTLRFPYALKFVVKLLSGNLKTDGHFTSFQANSLIVEGTGGMAHVDGEPIHVPEKVTFEIRPASLIIIH